MRLDLRQLTFIIESHRLMSQLSPQKRKQRRLQLRDAQRRRRARLKDENKTFLQIILNQELLAALREQSDARGKPMHTVAAELLRQALRADRAGSPETAKEAKSAKTRVATGENPDSDAGRRGPEDVTPV
ncbi:MAG TPA: hypothetical protein VGD78_12180 [Chthoniobacterales bacterium]